MSIHTLSRPADAGTGQGRNRQEVLLMDEKKSFGAYIRRKRQSAGLTQRDLAQALYVTESTVSKWERGGSLR